MTKESVMLAAAVVRTLRLTYETRIIFATKKKYD